MSIKAEISLDSTKAEAQASRAGAAIAGQMAKSSQGGSGGGFFKGAESGLTKVVSGINLGDKKSFRDLSKPIGAQDPVRQAKVQDRYVEFEDNEGTPKVCKRLCLPSVPFSI